MKTSVQKGVVILGIFVLCAVGAFTVIDRATTPVDTPGTIRATIQTSESATYSVVKVIDGDTIDVMVNGTKERIRMIGVNTPETVDPRKPVECFGREASSKTKSLLAGKKVILEKDDSQGDRDKYNRLLRYVVLPDSTNVNLALIEQGYAYEYTYNTPYKYQADFKNAQKLAMNQQKGLWGTVCQKIASSASKKPVVTQSKESKQQKTVSISSDSKCTIKGNISSNKDKIFHAPGCKSYDKTVIDESAGEKWFCSESEALQAGWRKAGNC